MKKKFDTNTVMNELRGQSVFFPNTKAETEQEMAVSTPPTLQKENIQPEMEVSERCPDTVIPRHHDTMQPSNLAWCNLAVDSKLIVLSIIVELI